MSQLDRSILKVASLSANVFGFYKARLPIGCADDSCIDRIACFGLSPGYH